MEIDLTSKSNEELIEMLNHYRKIEKIEDTEQMIAKLNINACYGFVSSKYSPLYQPDIGESICAYGRYQIRDIGETVCKEVKNKYNVTLNICLNDTDSLIIDCQDLVDNFDKDKTKTDDEICDMLDAFDKKVIQKIIRSAAKKHHDFLNCYEDALYFDREKIGTMIVTGKKHYAVSLLDNEGNRLHPRKLTVTGIEIKRSSTPNIMRIKLEEALKLIFEVDNETVIDFINNFKEEYLNKKYSLDEIAIPTGISNMEKYQNVTKSVPIHVRASKVTNAIIESKGLDYSKINSGDKIKWIRMKIPNPIKSDVIAFNDPNMIYDIGIDKYIDYQEMFEKTFIKPLSGIIEAIGWKMDIESSLMEEMF